jgi:hypothetical protein
VPEPAVSWFDSKLPNQRLSRLRLVAFALLTSFIAGASPYNSKTVQSEFESLAVTMPYLELDSVLYDRSRTRVGPANPAEVNLHYQILQKITKPRYSQEILLPLLKHRDAKVRTLALVALYDREDPSVLPTLVSLADDKERTFDGYPKLSPVWLRTTGLGPPQREQTVGYIADAMVMFYLREAGFDYGIRHATEPGFRDYWKTHNGRAYGASWFAV